MKGYLHKWRGETPTVLAAGSVTFAVVTQEPAAAETEDVGMGPRVLTSLTKHTTRVCVCARTDHFSQQSPICLSV